MTRRATIRWRIIGLAGYPGAGKTTVAELLRMHGVEVFDNRTVLIEEFGEGFPELSLRERIERFGLGESIFHFLAPRIRERLSAQSLLIVDSFKVPEDPLVLSRFVPEAMTDTLALKCPYGVRRARIASRGRTDDDVSIVHRDRELAVAGLDKLIGSARYTLNTNCDRAELETRVTALLRKL